MSTFNNTDGLHTTDPQELDRIALECAGLVATYGFGFSCPVATPQIPGTEYGTKVVNKQGMGNHGSIILVGLTPRTRALIREGKALSLYKQGVSWEVARVSAVSLYGMEPAVALLAEECLTSVEVHGPYEGSGHRDFDNWLGFDVVGLSYPRKASAAAIAADVIQLRKASR